MTLGGKYIAPQWPEASWNRMVRHCKVLEKILIPLIEQHTGKPVSQEDASMIHDWLLYLHADRAIKYACNLGVSREDIEHATTLLS